MLGVQVVASAVPAAVHSGWAVGAFRIPLHGVVGNGHRHFLGLGCGRTARPAGIEWDSVHDGAFKDVHEGRSSFGRKNDRGAPSPE